MDLQILLIFVLLNGVVDIVLKMKNVMVKDYVLKINVYVIVIGYVLIVKWD